MFSLIKRFDVHGHDRGFVFHPIGGDSTSILASMKAGTKMNVPDSCSINPWSGQATCSGASTATARSADGVLGNRGARNSWSDNKFI